MVLIKFFMAARLFCKDIKIWKNEFLKYNFYYLTGNV